ncbi:MAG: hypothetical protein ABIP94_23580 [Planctomycetota bacterium]
MQTNAVPWLPARTAKDGAFVCEGLHPRADALLLRRDGCATAVYVLPAAVAGQIDIGTLALVAPQVVQGIVRDRDDKPITNTLVVLGGTNGDRERWAPTPPNWSLLAHYLGQRLARTDAAGLFAFGDVAPGSYALALGDSMDAVPSSVAVEVKAGVDVPPAILIQ